MLIDHTGSSRSAAGNGQALYTRAKELIPGGTQLLSKRPEMFLPGGWPCYYSRAKGVEVWDLDGASYLDFTISGVGAPVLGFADDEVDSAVISCIRAGTMATLNCAEEVELAELLLDLHPWAEMVRYGRSGGEILAMAIRLARAAAGRDMVLFCGYHGWMDWYLSANLAEERALDGHLLPGLDPAGVPRGLSGSVLPFEYNNLADLERLAAVHGGSVAAIVMEPTRSFGPAPGFLEGVRQIADRIGAVLIFDEVTSGLRMTTGGVHLTYGVMPDLATFAKALGNGYPISALIGRRSVMEAAQRTFVSSTAWTERVGPTAALATLRKHRRENVAEHLIEIGNLVQKAWRSAADKAGLEIHISGLPPLSHIEFKAGRSPALTTLFTQFMLARGFLASASFYATYAHTKAQVEVYSAACHDAFAELAAALENDDVEARLNGAVKHSGFRRLA